MNAVVIAGFDPSAAASFALGVARVHGSVRRVAIADLVGEVPPLQSLVTGEDAHGISDSFLYGVSLNKIAQPLEGSGNVFLMPSGTEPVATEAVYRNERWRKLALGFQQVGALLLVVAVPSTPGFDELCRYVGAVFPIGEPAPAAPAGVPLISLPRPTPPNIERVVAKARAAGSEDPASRRRRLFAALFATIAVAVLVGILWPRILGILPSALARQLPGYRAGVAVAGDSGNAVLAKRSDTTAFPAPAGVVDSGGQRDSALATPDTLAARTAVPLSAGRRGALVVANPEDSSRASVYSVYVVASATRENAIQDARVLALPALAVSPVILGNDTVRWYRVTVGASEDQAAAEALINRLRAARVLGATSGTIVRVPYAFRLEQGLTAEAAPEAVARYAKRGLSAYALLQADGRVTIFTGAHESVVQAAILADSLRSMGMTPVLVYRTGRAF